MSINFKTELEDDDYRLVQMQDDHFDALYKLGSNSKVWEQHPERDRGTLEKFKIFFKDGIEHKEGCYIILDKKTGEFIGSTRYYDYDPEEGSVCIGYTFLTPEYWGTSTNFQVKKLMLDFAFRDLEKAYFMVGKENFRSQKATLKLGAKRFGEEGVNYFYVLEKGDWVGKL